MPAWRGPPPSRWWPYAAWLLLLAALPWWAGLPLLLALAAVRAVAPERLKPQVPAMRRALYAGLPGVLFAAQRALGGGAVAWVAALLGALAGYSVLALLDHLLDPPPRGDGGAAVSPAWPELAMAPVGPPAVVIELVPPAWFEATAAFDDPRGGRARRDGGEYLFDDGVRLGPADGRCCFSPGGRWFAAPLGGRGVLLWDRARGRRHRLRGWQLYGWHGEEPWLARGEDGAPQALKEALGEPGD